MTTLSATQIAQLILDWGQKKKELDRLEAQIQEACLPLARTQTVGDVRASYRKESVAQDWKTAWNTARDNAPVPAEYCKLIPDYRAACSAYTIYEAPEIIRPATVTLKLLSEDTNNDDN